MNWLRVALLQILPTGSLEGNLQKGREHCEKARAMGANIALFPEMWSLGYQIPWCEEELRRQAVTIDSPFIQAFSRRAKALQMAIAITYLEAHDPSPRNTVCLFDRHGLPVLTYAKVHLCRFDEDEGRLTAGDDFHVCDLDTAQGKVKLGAMICFDREFPESVRILMLKGAEVILVPNACPLEINRISQLRARAYENMLGIATANYPVGQPDCNGHSIAFDGMAYRPGAPVSRDTLIVEAGEGEGIYLADFPLEEIRSYRASEVHGNAYRRPGIYHLLVSETIDEPFIRENQN